tara:strand:+ start:194 stop:1084 length:891 start_codon:yes stop_codon:yes gene_type:complete
MITALCVDAQQDPQFSQNMFNKLANNPGFSGSRGGIATSVLHRSQWIGFGSEGGAAVSTQNFSVDAALPFLYGGVGLNIVTDKVAGYNNLGLQTSYAFRTELGLGQIGMGMSAGIFQSGLNGGFLNPATSGDPVIPTGDVQGSALDLGVGFYYNTQDVYIGFSSTHLTEPTIEWSDGQDYKLKRHYFLISGYTYDLNPDLLLHPSIYFKTDGATSQLDINTSLIYNNRMWGGVSYRLDDGIVLLTGINVNQDLKLGLAYDVVFSGIGNNSFEIMLAYNFKISTTKAISKYKNPRFL